MSFTVLRKTSATSSLPDGVETSPVGACRPVAKTLTTPAGVTAKTQLLFVSERYITVRSSFHAICPNCPVEPTGVVANGGTPVKSPPAVILKTPLELTDHA